MALMADWAYFAVEITTGRVVMDLPVTGFSGEVSLAGAGGMSASLPLLHLDNPDDRQQMIDCTTPGRYSLAALRNGIIVGEWIIWQRTRKNDLSPVSLSGSELLSLADHRVVPEWHWTQTEQLEIGRAMLATAFGPVGSSGGAVAIDIPSPARSGVLRDRDYKLTDGDIGSRLKELSDADDGFEYWITPRWASAGAGQIIRRASFAYPAAGITQPLVFDMAGAGPIGGGNILTLDVVDDATQLASRTYAVGSATADAALIGVYENGALITAGFPGLERTESFSTVTRQATIDAYAKSVWQDAQRTSLPQNMTVLADASPAVGDYQLGDTVRVHLEPSVNTPHGFDGQVRIIGWTFKPPDSGPEIVTLNIDPGNT